LPKSKLGVDVDDGFKPDYQPVKARESTIKELKSAVKKSDKVYLATDPDREGEAISWHLKELLKLPDDKAFRVTFNEITQKVVKNAIENPRPIDMSLVDAQQARRILDRIVGYKLSPLLWKKIRRGLSAGRVQSVASRMVVDRENEIRAFIPEEYWLLHAMLSTPDKKGSFIANYYGFNNKKVELKSEDDVNNVLNAIKSNDFTVENIKKVEKKRSASPPFITSTLQQEASRRHGMTPRQTMMIAQQLYEGIDITDEGTVGLITYMRTDSLRISNEAAADAKKYITSTYGEKSYPSTPNFYKSKGSAQDAHEAIRPSSVFKTPESIKSSLRSDQYRLYRLIWSRFVASQMAPAIYDSVTIDAVCANHIFRANNSVNIFPGFTAVYEEQTDDVSSDKKSENGKNAILAKLKENDSLKLDKTDSEQKFTQPPSRYTEATLIRAMEETGIGRPSTYAPTISTILSREYIVKEGKLLRPTALGEVVVSLMMDKFSDIVDLNFTARMEEQLDNIEKGNDNWQHVLSTFYDGFNKELTKAEEDLDGIRIKVPDEYSDEVCDVCGKQLVFKSGRFGRFLACPGYPECTFTKPIVIEMPGKCPKCGTRILKRTSKKGYPYYACENKDCDFITWDVPVADNCSECGKTMFKLSGKGAKKPFCVNDKCKNFLPEDKRGYRVKKTTEETTKTTAKTTAKKPATKKAPTTKKAATKKTPAKKTTK
ncbi:MAG: type I DNA topoisomerase, partial [Oscillospiraceae bacterium]|nr:type I DNA topoisomerase [Oscillospiraceae bacterium]